jgi:polyferredoxin
MNKLLKFLLVIVVLGTSSCTREFVCQCSVTYSGTQPGLPAKRVQEYTLKDTKATAEKKCSSNSKTTVSDNITLKEDCKLY